MCRAAQDLLPWNGRGISKEDVLQSIQHHTSTYPDHVHPGASIAFRASQAYVSSPINISVLLPHQRRNLVVYLQVVQVAREEGGGMGAGGHPGGRACSLPARAPPQPLRHGAAAVAVCLSALLAEPAPHCRTPAGAAAVRQQHSGHRVRLRHHGLPARRGPAQEGRPQGAAAPAALQVLAAGPLQRRSQGRCCRSLHLLRLGSARKPPQLPGGRRPAPCAPACPPRPALPCRPAPPRPCPADLPGTAPRRILPRSPSPSSISMTRATRPTTWSGRRSGTGSSPGRRSSRCCSGAS
jgi:hypothetical protein